MKLISEEEYQAQQRREKLLRAIGHYAGGAALGILLALLMAGGI